MLKYHFILSPFQFFIILFIYNLYSKIAEQNMESIQEYCQKVRLKQAMKMWSCIYKNQINQKIISSDQIQDFLPRFQCFHDPHEHVILNPIKESYNRLMRNCFVWLGPSKNQKKQLTRKSIVFLQKQQQLFLFYKQRCQYLQVVHIFSFMDQEIWETIKKLKECVKVQYYKITEPNDEIIEKILEQIGNKNCLQFPSFSQISVQQNKKINNERFWMYTIVNGINFRKSYQQFMQFLKYFIDNQPLFHGELLIELYKQCKRDSAFHDPVKYLKLYTGQLGLYRFLNMCLRSWSDSKDLGYIRFPFLQIFIAIKMLQNKQRHAFIQKSKAGIGLNSPLICYRSSGLKIKQLRRMKKGNLLQMTGFLSTSTSEKIANNFFKSDVEINVLFILKIPQVERSFNIFHSYCQVNWPISAYSEDQILLTPLNTFEVDKVEISIQHNRLLEQYQHNINDQLKVNRQRRNEIQVVNNGNTNNYSKVYLNYIDCENRLKQLKSKKNLEGKQKIFIENYKFQKDMFRLTRNQGELLWRLHVKIIFKRQYQHYTNLKLVSNLQIRIIIKYSPLRKLAQFTNYHLKTSFLF